METNIGLWETSSGESKFIQNLCLQGRWDDLMKYLKPIFGAYTNISKQVFFLVMKQKLLETLSWKGAGGERLLFPPWRPHKQIAEERENIDLNDILLQVNELKEYCNAQQFNSLCMFLTLENLEDHPEYKHWTVAQGRVQIFLAIQQFLSQSGLDSTVVHRDKSTLPFFFSAAFSHLQRTLENVEAHQKRPILAADPSGLLRVQSMEELSRILEMKTLPTRLVVSPHLHPLRLYVVPSQPEPTAAPLPTPLPQGDEREGREEHKDSSPPADQPAHGSSLQLGQTKKWPSPQSLAPAPAPLDLPAQQQSLSRPASTSSLSSRTHSQQPAPSRAPLDELSLVAEPIAPPQQPSQADKERARPVSWTVDLAEGAAEEVKVPPAHIRRRLQELAQSRDDPPLPQERSLPVTEAAPSRPKSSQQQRPRPEPKIEIVEERPERPERSERPSLVPQPSRKPAPAAPAPVPSSSSQPQSSPKKSGGQQQQPSSGGSAMVYSKHALFHVDTPLRCASLLTSFMPGESHPTDQPTYLAVGSNLKHIHLLSYRRRELLEDARASNASLTSLVDSTGLVRLEQTYENCHKGSVYCMDWMPAYRLLASGSNDKMVKLWRANGSAGSSLKGHNGTVRALRFRNPSQPSGEVLLASCGAGDFRPRIWDAAAESCQRILSPHADTVHGLAWLGDQVLATGDEAGGILVHDLRSSQVVWSINLSDLRRSAESSSSSALRSICCLSAISTQPAGSPSSSWQEMVLGVGCTGGHLTLLTSEKIIFDQKLHSDDIRSLDLLSYAYHHSLQAFSSFHQLQLLTSSYDASSALWQLQTAEDAAQTRAESQARFLGAHQDKNLCALRLPATSDVVTTGADGNVVLWMKH